MGSKNKKSGGKKKKSGGKSSKPRPESQPEVGTDSGTEMEETEAEKVLEGNLPSKKRKSGSDDGDGEEIPEENESKPSDHGADKGGKGKKVKSENDGVKVEAFISARQLRPRKLPKVFQDVTLVEGDFSRVIGRRIKVFWPLDVKWYSGHVKSFDTKKKRHHVVYDDGDEEWLELKKERIKIQVEHGEVFGGSGDGDALPPPAEESGMGKDKGKECGTGSVDKSKKNDVKEEESGGGDGKKAVAKRKHGSVVDNSKKNDGKRKKEGEGNAGREEDKEEEGREENAEKSKLEEDKSSDGGRKEDDKGNEATNDLQDDEGAGQVDGVGDDIGKNEAEEKKENKDSVENEDQIQGQAAEEKKENKDSVENEDQIQGQAAEDGKNAKRPKNFKKTAPRTKRGGSGKQTQQKHIVEDQTEDADRKQNRVEHTDASQDVKNDVDSRITENANYLKEENAPEVDSIHQDDDEKLQKAKESGAFSRKKSDSSGTETDTVDDMDAKASNKDIRKQEEQAEKLHEKNASAVVVEEQQNDEMPKQANEDEQIMPPTADQPNEKHSHTRADAKATEKQVDLKDTDQLDKKFNKKHRGKVKTREPGKR